MKMPSDAENDESLEIVEPAASNMVEALRDIGYSLESAVADILDNSISAAARSIDIRFGWTDDHKPWIAIIDNGNGMDAKELVEAMRPGGRDPLAKRKISDLGRFGLGLKTASFSQCRKVSVISKKTGQISARQWDLDLVRLRNKWALRTPSMDELGSFPIGPSSLLKCGTIVLWQELDRLDLGNSIEQRQHVMNERMMTIWEHVSLVFHRFISSEPGTPKVAMYMNGSPIPPFDPFNAKHPATMHLGDEVVELEGKIVNLKPYILPHHSKVDSKDYEALGGKEGYLRGQGFYVYRNRRLIIHGTWFRMARQEEITKLARVQVDIPNTLDHLWTIDVRKSRAQPPEAVKKRLRAILDRIREGAKRPYAHRGSIATSPAGEPVWIRKYHNDHISYSPNKQHPLIEEFRADLPIAMRQKFEGLLSVIGASLPFGTLFNDMASRPKETDSPSRTQDALEELAKLLFENDVCPDIESTAEVMRITEPFASVPNFVADYIARLYRKGALN